MDYVTNHLMTVPSGRSFATLQNSRFFFLKISKEIGKACRKSLTRAKRASLTRPAREKNRIFSVSPQVSLYLFSLVPDLLFDCSRVLEYAKIRTVLQSTVLQTSTLSRFLGYKPSFPNLVPPNSGKLHSRNS